jgi:hypothetical protein
MTKEKAKMKQLKNQFLCCGLRGIERERERERERETDREKKRERETLTEIHMHSTIHGTTSWYKFLTLSLLYSLLYALTHLKNCY